MSISELANKYNQLQTNMGVSDKLDWSEEIVDLFSETFTKAANGDVLVEKRSDLQNQIIMCREAAGHWTINVKDIIPAADNKHCTICYTLISEKIGNFEVIAILSAQSNQKIDSINEVYYQFN